MMTYDVQIGNGILRGIPYAELISLPIEPTTFIRRGSSDWILAQECTELTHILIANESSRVDLSQHDYNFQVADINSHNDNEDTLYEESNDYDTNTNCFEDDCVVENDNYQSSQPRFSPPIDSGVRYNTQEQIEERPFIPSAEYLRCKKKRNTALIGVLSLGLAGLKLIGVGNAWRNNIFAGTSFMQVSGFAFVLKCLSFCLWTALCAIPYFIYSLICLIYYQIRLAALKK